MRVKRLWKLCIKRLLWCLNLLLVSMVVIGSILYMWR